MRNKKNWLVLKAVFIVLIAVLLILTPATNSVRTWIRFAMLVFFTASFIIDLINYKKDNA